MLDNTKVFNYMTQTKKKLVKNNPVHTIHFSNKYQYNTKRELGFVSIESPL